MNVKIIFFLRSDGKVKVGLLDYCIKIEKSIVNLFGIILEHIFW